MHGDGDRITPTATIALQTQRLLALARANEIQARPRAAEATARRTVRLWSIANHAQIARLSLDGLILTTAWNHAGIAIGTLRSRRDT